MSKRFLLLCVSLTSLWCPAISKRHSPPSILKQPPTDELLFQVATQQNENDKPFIIECEADGEPAPTYRWVKNGKPFSWQAYDDRITQQPGRGTLVITKPKNEDLGQYQCFAENEWGTATSNSVFVRKAELNSFKDEPPTTLVAREGDPFKLTCHPPDGWPKPNVYWLIQNTDGGIKSINSSRMTLDPEGNLWFSNVTRQDASDDFTYSCTAMSVFRNEYKLGNKVVLSVIPTGSSPGQNRHAPVQQYVSRKQEVALRDKKVQLYCIFGGTPLPQTVWFKDGRPLQFSDRISQGNYGKSLVIKHVTYEDEGDYTCEASNGVGDAKSYSINLRVMAIPFFIEEPEIVNAAEGEVATFRCKASGNPEPQIQWIYNGKPISEAPPNPRRRITTNSVVIENLERSDTANYGCNATNSLGYVYKDVYLNVLAVAPEIVEMSPDEETVDNHNVTLMCRVSGVPKPQIKWIRNGVELTGGRYTVLDSGDLHISNVGFTDMGRYTCVARNKLGAVDMAVNLTVKQRTQIPSDLGPVDYEVQAGSPATFHCSPVKDDSLELTVEWLRNGEVINFESEPRYIRSNDYSLTITKTTELDSGIYTCLASTRLDEARAQATLIVQDVPNAPKLVGVICNAKDASVTWQPMGDNRAPILNYVIQYNTSFSPDLWDDAVESVPAAESSYNVPMSPWANYTFRVMARNKIGVSLPSPHSSVCRTDPDLPYKNPDNVEARGTKPDNLIIRWTPMSEIEHNAPRFHYQVSWKRDVPGSSWTVQDVPDWRTGMLEVNNQPTFQRYLVKVVAINEKGQANVAPAIVLGYSGENVPTEPPSNLTLIGKPTATGAHVSWLPVSPDSLRGHFKGYKIQTWVEGEKEKGAKFMEVGNDTTEADINMLVPYTKNYVRVVAFNSAYNGPPSEVLIIETPEGVPGPVQSLDAIPLANSAFYLTWKPPLQPNGILTGYRIYYQTVTGTELGPLLERKPLIMDSAATGAKLAGLEPGTKYRIHLNATTVAGIGSGYWIERYTRGSLEMQPNPPAFTWSRVEQSEIFASLKIVWVPDEKKPGAHFYVKYRMKGHPEFIQTEPVLNEIHTIVGGLTPGYIYEFLVVSVDGVYSAESEPEEIDIYMPDAVLMTRESFFTAGWFVGMILAIAVLTIILILVCLVRRNRGGKYAVHEQEAMHRRQDFPDEPAFHEYSQPLSNAQRGLQRQESKPVESDSDSMAEYGDGETEGMNEDGSFIGLYGRQRRPDGGSTSFATVV